MLAVHLLEAGNSVTATKAYLAIWLGEDRAIDTMAKALTMER